MLQMVMNNASIVDSPRVVKHLVILAHRTFTMPFLSAINIEYVTFEMCNNYTDLVRSRQFDAME